ncbi:TPA_asm: hypothetical protein [Capsaspora MELD virus 1]|nr:TPA_asm: hypothetical protein [Capsaspora MELD virus 1]
MQSEQEFNTILNQMATIGGQLIKYTQDTDMVDGKVSDEAKLHLRMIIGKYALYESLFHHNRYLRLRSQLREHLPSMWVLLPEFEKEGVVTGDDVHDLKRIKLQILTSKHPEHYLI